MHQKTAFWILAGTLLIAVFCLNIVSNDTISGSVTWGKAVYEQRPQCNPPYNDIQLRTDPMPLHCYPGYHKDSSPSKYYMCCNMYYEQQSGRYYQPQQGRYY